MQRVALYVRVSTLDQDPSSQLRELRAYAKRRGWRGATEYVDHGVSGAKDRRPALDALMALARRRKLDVVVVWALDRWGRSLGHLVQSLAELTYLGVAFVAASQGIDTTSDNPASTLTLQVLGAVAQFEREMIRARVVAGVAKARAQGKTLGRPRASVDVGKARRMIRQGASLRSTARALGASRTTLQRALGR